VHVILAPPKQVPGGSSKKPDKPQQPLSAGGSSGAKKPDKPQPQAAPAGETHTGS
jgi:hypothetical protein